MRVSRGLAAGACVACVVGVSASPGSAATVTVERASTASDGTQGAKVKAGDDREQASVVSADGSVVAFVSRAKNLVPGGTNGLPQVFAKNLTTGVTTLVSASASGEQTSTGTGDRPAISADGTKVAFTTHAPLVPEDTRTFEDVFVKDLVTGSVVRASTTTAGAQAGNHSFSPSLSADGTKVAFTSEASNLVPGDTNGKVDVFVKDLPTGAITRASVTAAGKQGLGADPSVEGENTGKYGSSYGASLSADGSRVAFVSYGKLTDNDRNPYADVYVKNVATGNVALASPVPEGMTGDAGSASISGDNKKVAFVSNGVHVPGDTNKTYDVFVFTPSTHKLVRVSTDAKGKQANQPSASPSLSADGSKVAFATRASNLVPGDTNGTADVFVKNLTNNQVVRVLGSGGAEGNLPAALSALSADGSTVSFTSAATNLVPGDTNTSFDTFVARLS